MQWCNRMVVAMHQSKDDDDDRRYSSKNRMMMIVVAVGCCRDEWMSGTIIGDDHWRLCLMQRHFKVKCNPCELLTSRWWWDFVVELLPTCLIDGQRLLSAHVVFDEILDDRRHWELLSSNSLKFRLNRSFTPILHLGLVVIENSFSSSKVSILE
jgi:hypothetical protein